MEGFRGEEKAKSEGEKYSSDETARVGEGNDELPKEGRVATARAAQQARPILEGEGNGEGVSTTTATAAEVTRVVTEEMAEEVDEAEGMSGLVI